MKSPKLTMKQKRVEVKCQGQTMDKGDGSGRVTDNHRGNIQQSPGLIGVQEILPDKLLRHFHLHIHRQTTTNSET